jgi:seryl-tRNA synthetase
VLDIRKIRQDAETINGLLKRRNPQWSVDEIEQIDVRRLALLQEEEQLRAERNQMTQQIAKLRKEGQNADTLQNEARTLADRIREIDTQKEALALQQETLLLNLPNTPLVQTPVGKDETGNVLLRTWGDEFKSRTCQNPRPHYEIGVELGILDFERGVKVAQSRFSVLRSDGARLERALINFMLDTHTANGYEEILPPFLVNRQALTGTGQLPKFEEDVFACQQDALFLIPTAEVPVTNLYAGEILDEQDLPLSMVAYTPCFRREAGSAGKDTRGLIRQHQFDKVELVKLVHPEQSEAEHLKLLADAESILQLLELPYRVIELCTGDIGFSAARCFDLEVWMPAQQTYREISSCSVFTDYQARRIGLRYRSEATGKTELLHTLNGSGLAVGRTLAAILENYQITHQEVEIPAVLQPYCKNRIERLQIKC